MRKVTKDPSTGEFVIKFFTRDTVEWAEILKGVKTIPGRAFEPKQKYWTCPANEESIKLLVGMGFEFDTEVFVPDKEWTEPWKGVKFERALPEYLRDYQQETMKFLKYRNGRGLIADDMGIGKTVQALGFLKMSGQLPALIVVPATIKRQWFNQFRRFVDKTSDLDILSGKTSHNLCSNTSYIINWDILSDWLPTLKCLKFKTLIADESHRCGNSKSQRTKALKELSKSIPYFLPMSGTPIKTRPAQFFPVLNMLDPIKFNNEWKFLQRYCDPKYDGFGWSFKGSSNQEELHRLVREYMIRREKSDVLKDLPEKQVTVIPLDTAGNWEYYQNSLEAFQKSTGKEASAAFSNLKMEAFALKQDFVVKWLKEFTEDGRKIFVGTYHRKVIEFLSGKFKNSVHIYGGVNQKERDKAIEEFKSNPDVSILFGQILSAGEGIDGLQNSCSDCAFVEFANAPAEHNQFEDRLHRDGQKNPVTVYYLIADGTIEEDIVKLMDERKEMFNQIVNGRATDEVDFINYLRRKAV